MTATGIILFGIIVAAACLIGARRMGGKLPVLRTALYTLVALIIAFLLWLAVMAIFVGPAMKKM